MVGKAQSQEERGSNWWCSSKEANAPKGRALSHCMSQKQRQSSAFIPQNALYIGWGQCKTPKELRHPANVERGSALGSMVGRNQAHLNTREILPEKNGCWRTASGG